jgi:hypothetical protein
VRKEYDVPGQTKDTPPEGDPLRKFYGSLLVQRPDSEMARSWCGQRGLLPAGEAEKWVREQARAKGKAAPGSAAAPRKRPSAAADAKPAKKAKAAAPKKKAAAATSASSEESAGESSDEEVVPAARKRVPAPAAKPAAKPAPKPAAKAKAAPKPAAAARDVAFADGGMDGSDSDDDVPLLQRKAAA